MKIHFSEKRTDYDGAQLAPHWIYKNFDLSGDALVAFIGRCAVAPERMVDLADLKEGKRIFSESMLHFIGEFFDTDLTRTILLQHLLVSLAQQEITIRVKTPTLIRAGNDLYEGDSKLSISVATASPVSTLLHFGINISSRNTPVKTKGLTDYGLDPGAFARSLLETFKHEIEGVAVARSKVRAVG